MRPHDPRMSLPKLPLPEALFTELFTLQHQLHLFFFLSLNDYSISFRFKGSLFAVSLFLDSPRQFVFKTPGKDLGELLDKEPPSRGFSTGPRSAPSSPTFKRPMAKGVLRSPTFFPLLQF